MTVHVSVENSHTGTLEGLCRSSLIVTTLAGPVELVVCNPNSAPDKYICKLVTIKANRASTILCGGTAVSYWPILISSSHSPHPPPRMSSSDDFLSSLATEVERRRIRRPSITSLSELQSPTSSASPPRTRSQSVASRPSPPPSRHLATASSLPTLQPMPQPMDQDSLVTANTLSGANDFPFRENLRDALLHHHATPPPPPQIPGSPCPSSEISDADVLQFSLSSILVTVICPM